MFQENVSMGLENAADLLLRQKKTRDQSKNTKHRTKALSDVKNTIHSHSSKSNLNINESKKIGKITNLILPDNVNLKENSVFSVKEDCTASSKNGSDFICHNHLTCEEVNNIHTVDFHDEFKLSKKDLSRFSDRMKLFSFKPYQINIASGEPKPMNDLEFNEIRRPNLDDEDYMNDDMKCLSLDIPEPSFI